MKLFMFYVGGDCGNSNVELHDVRFSIGETFEDCYPDLRRQWWGDPKSLHLDCWGAVEWADGYDVSLSKGMPPGDGHRLFFVNLGGYRAEEFAELHKNILLVASDAKAATKKAMILIKSWSLPHKDNVFEIEKAVDVSAAMQETGYFLELTESSVEKPFVFSCDYVPIGK